MKQKHHKRGDSGWVRIAPVLPYLCSCASLTMTTWLSPPPHFQPHILQYQLSLHKLRRCRYWQKEKLLRVPRGRQSREIVSALHCSSQVSFTR